MEALILLLIGAIALPILALAARGDGQKRGKTAAACAPCAPQPLSQLRQPGHRPRLILGVRLVRRSRQLNKNKNENKKSFVPVNEALFYYSVYNDYMMAKSQKAFCRAALPRSQTV